MQCLPFCELNRSMCGLAAIAELLVLPRDAAMLLLALSWESQFCSSVCHTRALWRNERIYCFFATIIFTDQHYTSLLSKSTVNVLGPYSFFTEYRLFYVGSNQTHLDRSWQSLSLVSTAWCPSIVTPTQPYIQFVPTAIYCSICSHTVKI